MTGAAMDNATCQAGLGMTASWSIQYTRQPIADSAMPQAAEMGHIEIICQEDKRHRGHQPKDTPGQMPISAGRA